MVSAALVFAGGFALGAVVGVLGFMFYIRHRTRKQLQQMEEQMGQMFDPDAMDGAEELDAEP